MPVDDPNVVKQLEAPVPWIGLYAAAASTICTLAMAADILRGFRSRKYWFPSKYFSLNATSLTLLAVAMKLPMDLTTEMYSATDRLAKVSSIAFMAITTANFLTSLGSMDDKSLLMNVVALGILVITIVGNVCIQIIQMRSFLNSRRALWEESLAMASMLLLLFMFISSALTIISTKQQLKTMYHDRHKSAKNEGQLVDMRRATTKKLRVLIRKYWVMAETSSPQFVIARSVTSTVSGIVTLLVAIILVEAEIRIAIKEGIFDQTYSSYKKSTRGILLSQTIGVIVGAIAPISRWFVAINYKCRMNNENAFTVESYWTEKLVEWRQSSLSVEIRHLKSRKALHDLKGLIVKLSISVQHLIVLASKLVLVVSIWMTRSIKSSLNYITRSRRNQISDSGSEGSMANAQVDTRRYVIQLEGEVELPAETLRNIFKEMDEIIKKGKTRKPKNLLDLLSKSCNFNGVREFDSSDQVPQQIPYCWSLSVVTLTCIALAIPNVDKDKSECLLHSVTEGLRYMKLIDKLLDKKGQLAKVRAAADAVYVGVELKRKWLDKNLDDIASQGENVEEILQYLIQDSERRVLKLKKDPRYWPRKVIAANSMYRVSKTILLNHQGGKSVKTDRELFEKLSIMIADILAACLTNLPRAIIKMCHRDAIEKREKGVRKAAMYLGETEEIIAVLQERDLPPVLTTNEAAYIDEWRAKYSQEVVSRPESTADHITINIETNYSCD
ncbi:hypothetical protein C2S52_015444 [Perilla frutescens var. hirtella]|nr:hypothetical protein C2S52_015444 [Perilla frutescens var. hirtella]